MHRFGKACGFAAIFLMAWRLGSFALGMEQISPVHAMEDPARPEFYTAHVKPIFDSNCARCHGGAARRGGLNMDTRDSLLKGGHDGPAIVPGDPDHSLLVRLIRHEGPADDPMEMPPHKPKLADSDIATVALWIKAGAAMPPPSN